MIAAAVWGLLVGVVTYVALHIVSRLTPDDD